jgi:drug/metabolite transporter (DMT)-like permease
MSTDTSRRAKLIACFAVVYLVWGSTYAVSSIGVHALPPFLFGGIRFTAAGIILLSLALMLGRRLRLDREEWRHMIIVALLNVFIANGCTTWAMQYVPSNQTAILNASAALFIAMLATRGRRAHPIDGRTLTGLVVGFAGTALIIWPHGGLVVSHFGSQLIIIVGVFSWSVAAVYIRNVSSKLDVLSFTGLQMLIGGVMLVALGVGTGEVADWTWSRPGLIAMAYLTIASSCIAYTAFTWLAKNTTPAMVGTYGYVNPAIAAVLGWWLLNEELSAAQIVGMAVMLAGVALVSWPQNTEEPTGS